MLTVRFQVKLQIINAVDSFKFGMKFRKNIHKLNKLQIMKNSIEYFFNYKQHRKTAIAMFKKGKTI